VQFLLDHGADINILDNKGRSALEYATGALNWSKTSKAEQVVKLIIQAGADVNVKSTLGHTPLIWAARAGNLKITKLLLDKGANVQDTDNDGNNALHYARNPSTKHDSRVRQNRQATIRLLRKHGGKTGEELPPATLREAIFRDDLQGIKDFLAKGADVNAKSDEGGTPLHEAAIKGHKEIVELLIAEGADVNAKVDRGNTPLDWAILNDETATADLLRKHGGKTGEELKAEGK
jgi:ankyrin repeat protein